LIPVTCQYRFKAEDIIIRRSYFRASVPWKGDVFAGIVREQFGRMNGTLNDRASFYIRKGLVKEHK